MNKIIKRVTAILLAAVLIAIVPLSTSEAATKVEYPKTVYTYVDPCMYGNIDINNIKKTDRISNVKVADKSVVSVESVTRNMWVDEKGKEVYNANISFRAKKVGKTVVSYKLGGKTYKTTVITKAYANPIKSINIFGIKNDAGSTNLASETATEANTSLYLDEVPTSKKITITGAKDYKVVRVEVRKIISEFDNWNDVSVYECEAWDKWSNKLSVSIKDKLTFDNGEHYVVYIGLINVKNNAYRNVDYKIFY